jgi:hypothetical protein
VQIKDRQQLLTIVAIAGISLLALDRIVRPPLMNLWDARNKEIQNLQSEVREGESYRKRKDDIHSRWAQIQAGSLPVNTSLAEQQLYTGLNRWSESSGISVNSITPQWKQGSDAGFKTLECRVDAIGSIDRLSRFLYDLERDPMDLKLQSVELTARDNEGQQLALGVQVSALVLVQKDQATK